MSSAPDGTPKSANAPSLRSFTPWPALPAVQAPPSPITVLVVDPDGVSRRFVELALGRARDKEPLVVEAAKDATSALDVLRTTLVDLILSETDLPDMNGMRFYRRLQQESRLRNIPFVFLSADRRVGTKVVALGAGAEDYIDKPCDAAELTARVEGLITRGRRAREAQRRRGYTLAGDFSTVSFPDLVSILELARKTGLLSIASARATGELFFEEGKVTHAVFGNLTGREAFYRLMEETGGHFEFITQSADACAYHTIEESVTALIMEGARLLDDHRAGKSLNVPSAPPSVRAAQSARVPSLPVPSAPLAPLAPTRALAQQFDLGISDAFSLAELQLWNQEELTRWSRAPGGRDRLHVHLIADLSAGVSALLGIAAQPTERWVLSGLAAEPKALGLAFFLRSGRLLDLVLIDVRNAGRWKDALQRRAALAIVAPPNGDFLAIGPKSLVELERLFQRLPPAVVLGAGNATLEARLGPLLPRDAEPAPRVLSSSLSGGAQADLRALLLEGIRGWASTNPTPSRPPREPSPPPHAGRRA
jgi:DNA-binding response OmpR family regulator